MNEIIHVKHPQYNSKYYYSHFTDKKLQHKWKNSDFNPRIHALNQMPPHKNVRVSVLVNEEVFFFFFLYVWSCAQHLLQSLNHTESYTLFPFNYLGRLWLTSLSNICRVLDCKIWNEEIVWRDFLQKIFQMLQNISTSKDRNINKIIRVCSRNREIKSSIIN